MSDPDANREPSRQASSRRRFLKGGVALGTALVAGADQDVARAHILGGRVPGRARAGAAAEEVKPGARAAGRNRIAGRGSVAHGAGSTPRATRSLEVRRPRGREER